MSGTPEASELPEFTQLPDLAVRQMGSTVVATNDELFAEKENLIKPEAPTYSTYTFGHKGQVYDGWETRRHRNPGLDWAVIRLGVGGIVRGVVVDTAYFKGNYPPSVSIQGAVIEGYPAPEELPDADWFEVLPESPVTGDSLNPFEVQSNRYVTHIRLTLHPDGGVARLRVHGDVVPNPELLALGTVDLAALENGGTVTDCSNRFYSSPTNLILPGDTRVMGEGWETARRRDDGNDWVELALAGPGTIRLAEIDTRYFVGNAPGWARLTGWTESQAEPIELLPRTRLQPDTKHRFVLECVAEVSHVRLDVYPDGGMARVRLWGDLSDAGLAALTQEWTAARQSAP